MKQKKWTSINSFHLLILATLRLRVMTSLKKELILLKLQMFLHFLDLFCLFMQVPSRLEHLSLRDSHQHFLCILGICLLLESSRNINLNNIEREYTQNLILKSLNFSKVFLRNQKNKSFSLNIIWNIGQTRSIGTEKHRLKRKGQYLFWRCEYRLQKMCNC